MNTKTKLQNPRFTRSELAPRLDPRSQPRSPPSPPSLHHFPRSLGCAVARRCSGSVALCVFSCVGVWEFCTTLVFLFSWCLTNTCACFCLPFCCTLAARGRAPTIGILRGCPSAVGTPATVASELTYRLPDAHVTGVAGPTCVIV